jgi:hypothetical protein
MDSLKKELLSSFNSLINYVNFLEYSKDASSLLTLKEVNLCNASVEMCMLCRCHVLSKQQAKDPRAVDLASHI